MSVVLATAGFDHKVRFWEAPSGICTKMIKYNDSQINKLEITPDKQFIAAAGNPSIRLYEILDSNNSGTTNNNPDGSDNTNTNTASASGAGAGGGQQQQQLLQQAVLTLEGHTANVTSIGFQKDGRYLYSSSEDNTIKIWDLRNPNYSHSWDVGCPVNSVCLRSDKDEFISGDQNGYVKVWDLAAGGTDCVRSIQPSTEFSKSSSASSPMSNTPSPSNDGGNKTSSNNNTGRGRRRRRHNRYSEGTVPIQAVDISEDSRTLVAVSNHGSVYVWDPSSSSSSNSGGGVGAAASSSSQQQQQSVFYRPITTFRAHTEIPGTYCLHAKIAPDCRHLVTTASDGTAKLWDTATWELTQTLLHHNVDKSNTNTNTNNNSKKWVWDAAFCADSSYLVTASSDHIARLWNLRNGNVVRQYHGHQSAVMSVALNDSSV